MMNHNEKIKNSHTIKTNRGNLTIQEIEINGSYNGSNYNSTIHRISSDGIRVGRIDCTFSSVKISGVATGDIAIDSTAMRSIRKIGTDDDGFINEEMIQFNTKSWKTWCNSMIEIIKSA